MKVNSVNNQSFGLRVKVTPAYKEVMKEWKGQFFDVSIARALKKLRRYDGMNGEVELVKTFNRHKNDALKNVGTDTFSVKITTKDGSVIQKDVPFIYPFKPFNSQKFEREYVHPCEIAEDIITTAESKGKKPNVINSIKAFFA